MPFERAHEVQQQLPVTSPVVGEREAKIERLRRILPLSGDGQPRCIPQDEECGRNSISAAQLLKVLQKR